MNTYVYIGDGSITVAVCLDCFDKKRLFLHTCRCTVSSEHARLGTPFWGTWTATQAIILRYDFTNLGLFVCTISYNVQIVLLMPPFDSWGVYKIIIWYIFDFNLPWENVSKSICAQERLRWSQKPIPFYLKPKYGRGVLTTPCENGDHALQRHRVIWPSTGFRGHLIQWRDSFRSVYFRFGKVTDPYYSW